MRKKVKKKAVKKVKKKVGRPKKKVAVKKVGPKKKVGRPKGSKNKVKKTSTESKGTGKKRGRPRGSKNKSSTESHKKPHWLPEDYKEPKAFKLLGYCTCKDRTMITTADLVSKFCFVCPACERKLRTNKLRKEKRTDSVGMDKKAWLNDGIDATHHDMPALNDAVEDIKVADT